MRPTLYQTFKLQPSGRPPVFIMVIAVWVKEKEIESYDLLNLDGSLSVQRLSPPDFVNLLNNKQLVPWVPVK